MAPAPHFDSVEVAQNADFPTTGSLNFREVFQTTHTHNGGTGFNNIIDDWEHAAGCQMGGRRTFNPAQCAPGHFEPRT